jgi:hypothetical protein
VLGLLRAGRALGTAVGDQTADRGDHFGQVVAIAGPAVQAAPLLRLGDGVFDHDPPLGLAAAGVIVEVTLAGPRVLAGPLRRGADLVWEVSGQAGVAGVDLGPDVGVQP